MGNISAKWKRNKEISFTKGSMFVSALAAMVCFIVYNVTGAKVMPDGTLVEPFALMPIGYMISLMFLISLICYLVFLKKYRNNTK